MAQLVVASAFAAIGGAIGGPAGAQIGWTIGSAVGGQMFGEKAEGPKISQGKFTSSIYGQPIPVNYGTRRHGTQVVWWSGLIIRTEEVGGKGGGGVEVQKARMNLLLGVCEGPAASVLRIWANGRLIYDALARIGGFIDPEVLPAGDIRIYLGTEDQVADPTYEAAVGSANAVPYRGMVMIAIDALEGEQFANRPPNIEVEVASGPVDYGLTFATLDPPAGVDAWANEYIQSFTFDYTAEAAVKAANAKIFTVDSDDFVVVEKSRDTVINASVLSRHGGIYAVGVGAPAPESGEDLVVNEQLFGAPNSWTPYTVLNRRRGYYFYWPGILTVHENKWRCHFTNGLYGNQVGVAIYSDGGGIIGWTSGAPNPGWCFGAVGEPGGEDAWRINAELGPPSAITTSEWSMRFGYLNASSHWWHLDRGEITVASGTAAAAPGIAYDATRDRLWLRTWNGTAHTIEWIDLYSGNRQTLDVAELAAFGLYAAIAYNADLDMLIVAGWDGTTTRVVGYSVRTAKLDAMLASGDPLTAAFDESAAGAPSIGGGRLYEGLSKRGYAVFLNGAGTKLVKVTFTTAYDARSVTLASIVESICQRAGLPAENLDASAGTDLVRGYKLAAQTTARQAIEALVPGYFFDLVESGTQLVLRKRGADAVATIDAGELGAHIHQITADGPQPAYELEHVEEAEVPRRLELTYVDADANYDPGVQAAERQVGEALAPAQIDVPVVFHGGAGEAARAAWVNLLHAHACKNRISLKLSHARANLEAADAIIVPLAAGIAQRVRIERVVNARPMVEIEGVIEEQSIYTQGMGGAPRYQGPAQDGIGMIGDTQVELLDLPPLRESDNRFVLYVAMSRENAEDAWPGAVLYKSIDGGSTYDATTVSTTKESTIGALTEPLPAWTRGNVWDRVNTIRVRLTRGTLSSASDLAVLNGANAAVVGREIVQFRDAALVGDGEWEVSMLLRHRLGTEWAALADHAVGTRFVLLSELTTRVIEYPMADLNVARQWKGVTIGRAISDAPVSEVVAIGNSIKPLAPVHIKGARDGAGNLTVTWIRRARLNAEWRDGADVPLDETSEQYRVYVWTDAGRTATKRTEDVTAATWAYSAAEQTTDFGSPQAVVYLTVIQITPTYAGLGHNTGEAAL